MSTEGDFGAEAVVLAELREYFEGGQVAPELALEEFAGAVAVLEDIEQDLEELGLVQEGHVDVEVDVFNG